MKTLAQSVIEVINEKGIPSQWQEFGMRLSADGAISTGIVHQIMKYRAKQDPVVANDIFTEFDKKIDNLKQAQNLLSENMDDYDTNNIWRELDTQIHAININDIVTLLREDFAIHSFPMVLESLKFNWGYMKKNGVREFYTMTMDYLKEMEKITQDAKERFKEEVETGVVKPYWLLRSDLLSIEVPMHCDVCRITIAVIIAAKELSQTNFLVSASKKGEVVRV